LDRLATTNLARSGATDQNLRKILYAIRLFDEIMAALEDDALQAIIDDSVFDERRLAKTGSLGHRVLSMLIP